MVSFIKKNKPNIIFFITGLLLGFIFCTIILVFLICYRLDDYYSQVQQLQSDLIDKESKIAIYENELVQFQENQQRIVSDIQVVLTCDEDKIDEIEFVKHIKDKFNVVLGKEVDAIDLDVVELIIDNRIFLINDKEYQLKIEKMILSTTLTVHISAELYEKSN